jgi:hypothetical protein
VTSGSCGFDVVCYSGGFGHWNAASAQSSTDSAQEPLANAVALERLEREAALASPVDHVALGASRLRTRRVSAPDPSGAAVAVGALRIEDPNEQSGAYEREQIR